MTFQATHISISIAKSKQEVYQYVSNPRHFPDWLAFVKSISKKSENSWTAQTDLGEITFDLVPPNEFGVIDHTVTLADGTTLTNHLRVISNDDGSEVIFTLYRMPDKTQAEFDEDANRVRVDVKKLKEILEG